MSSIAHLPKTYKAAICNTPNTPWEITTRELRAPAADEVLIRVHASGICSSDHFVKDGTWPGLSYPRVTGHEVVGRVAAAGSAVKDDPRFAVGALVGAGWNGGFCGRCALCRRGERWACTAGATTGFTFDGGHAEYMYCPETGAWLALARRAAADAQCTAAVSLPEEALQKASYAELAPLLCGGATVYDALRTTAFKPGDVCLVQGIGGLGHLAVQYAVKMGLKVYAVSSGAAKHDMALALGAHAYLDASTTDVVAAMQAVGGASVIICTAPRAAQISAIIPAVAKNGTVTLVSAATDAPVQVSNLLLNMNRAALRGWCCGCAADMEQCVKFSLVADVKAIVQEYSLEEYAKAYDGVIANEARFRNVIVFP
ncbi:chaperonin 10-like protein [Amylocystis lapponica]|nr:chaperonin 10-like protein [Amylocystis lapponica]